MKLAAPVQSKLALADAQPAWKLAQDGRMDWGPGGAGAVDTSLYRGGANLLRTGGQFYAGADIVANAGAAGQIWLISDGRLAFGTAADTTLYREAANSLRTTGKFVATELYATTNGVWSQRPSATLLAFAAWVGTEGGAADAYDRWDVQTDGKMRWGPGNVVPDTLLYRAAAGSLATDGTFNALGFQTAQPSSGVGYIYRPAGNSYALGSLLQADSQYRFLLDAYGRMGWGPGGASGGDTNLYRAGAGNLATDGTFNAQTVVVAGETYGSTGRWFIDGGGAHQWGPGDWSRDTYISRIGVNVLQASGRFLALGDVCSMQGNANQIWLSNDGRVYWGSASDTSLYRTAANSLETGNLNVTGLFECATGRLGKVAAYASDWNNALDNGWYMYAGAANAPGGSAGWMIGQVLAHGAAGWRIQRLTDFTANADSQMWERRQLNGTWGAWTKSGLYSPGAGLLATDYSLQVVGPIWANAGLAGQIYLAGDGKLYFGSASDTNLYRSAADTLKTDDSLIVAGNLTVSGTINSASTIPTGAITEYAGSAAPTGWLLADGSAVSRATYGALFAVLGTTYGAGDGSTTFNLPNMKGRAPVGYDAANANHNALGKTGGVASQVMSAAEMPSHAHGVSDPGHVHHIATNAGGNVLGGNISGVTTSGNAGGTGAATGISIQAAGGNAAQNNLQPYISVNYIIKT